MSDSDFEDFLLMEIIKINNATTTKAQGKYRHFNYAINLTTVCDINKRCLVLPVHNMSLKNNTIHNLVDEELDAANKIQQQRGNAN